MIALSSTTSVHSGISDTRQAIIFRKSNIKDLTEKLQEACDDIRKVGKLKEQAADFICDKYNWDEVVDKTLALYGEKSQ